MRSPAIPYRTWPWELVTDIKLPAGYYLYRSKQSHMRDLVYGAEEFIRWFPAYADDREILQHVDDHMYKRLERHDQLLALLGVVWET